MNDNDLNLGIMQTEDFIADSAMKVALSRALSGLYESEGWKKLLERVGMAEAAELERLRTSVMDPYQLGRRQGYLRALRMFTSIKPMSEQELADIEEAVSMARDNLDHLRQLKE